MPKPNYATHISPKGPTPQSEAIPGTAQVPNNAGGFVFEVGDWSQLDRFLILGAEGNTYYVEERKLVQDNAKAVQRCIVEDGPRVVRRLVEISDSGRAPKNEPALFVLALCASAADDATRSEAFRALPKVARIGTHLFHFAAMVNELRGWGRGLRRAVGRWYSDQLVDKLAMNLVKYQSRDGWSNRDMLRLAHVKPTAITQPLLRWAVGKPDTSQPIHPLIDAFEMLKANPKKVDLALQLIRESNLPREALPTELLNDVEIWRELLQEMPPTATLRNLGKMTSIGLLKPLAKENQIVADRLTNAAGLRRARVHPLALLLAQATYVQGHGTKGKLSWQPVQAIVDALDEGFYEAFQAVEPTGKAIMLALDVSGSMGNGSVAGSGITPRAASAAMALVTAATEKNTHIIGFTADRAAPRRGSFGGYHSQNAVTVLPITPRMRLDQVVETISGLPFGATNCALPMIYAIDKGLRPDAFVVYTDNETWAGSVHPAQALVQYRKHTGIDAKLIVVGMTATGFTIADPNDPGMLDVVGFDAATPAIIADFIRG